MNQQTNKVDPLKKQATVENLNTDALSPMAPPEAYEGAIPKSEGVNDDNPFLKELVEEHVEFKEHISKFTSAMHHVKDNRKFDVQSAKIVCAFFEYFDREFVVHNKKEERYLFPILAKKLLEHGEHSTGLGEVTTPVDILESEHIQALQLGAIISNSFEILPRINHQESYYTILSNTVNKGFVLAELLNLHIHREDNIVFTLAKNLISKEEFDVIQKAYEE